MGLAAWEAFAGGLRNGRVHGGDAVGVGGVVDGDGGDHLVDLVVAEVSGVRDRAVEVGAPAEGPAGPVGVLVNTHTTSSVTKPPHLGGDVVEARADVEQHRHDVAAEVEATAAVVGAEARVLEQHHFIVPVRAVDLLLGLGLAGQAVGDDDEGDDDGDEAAHDDVAAFPSKDGGE